MRKLTPRISINGRDVDFLDGALTSTGGLTAASLQFKLPLRGVCPRCIRLSKISR
jgi:hypothetical protein